MARASFVFTTLVLGSLGLACQRVPHDASSNADDEDDPDTFGTMTPPQGGDDEGVPWGEEEGEEETGAEEPEAGDGGGGFIEIGDGGPPPMCDPTLEGDCGEGMRCVAYALEPGLNVPDAHKCIPIVTKPKQVGEPCAYDEDWSSGWDDCDAGLICWDRMNGEGVCLEVCSWEGECETEGTMCNVNKTIPLCFWPCDPTASDCPPTCGCYGDFDAPTCFPRGELDRGEPCQYINDCAPGLQCIAGDYLVGCAAEGCCTDWCHVSDGDCEGPNGECVPFYEEGNPEFEDFGICVTMP